MQVKYYYLTSVHKIIQPTARRVRELEYLLRDCALHTFSTDSLSVLGVIPLASPLFMMKAPLS